MTTETQGRKLLAEPSAFAVEVRTIRRSLDLTQEQLADILGVSRGLIAQWETGRIPVTTRTLFAVRYVAWVNG